MSHRAICAAGHCIELVPEFDPPKEVIAQIGWCLLEVSKKEYGGIIVPCNERVIWVRNRKL
jgi:hypothetical protein